jgi:adenylosuccinate lyase
MIPRYESLEISTIWSDNNKFQNFLKIEIELLFALEDKKIIPVGIAENIAKNAVQREKSYGKTNGRSKQKT